ncbi:MAG: sulfurtransferase [Geobacteraceae bacterium GWC2_53_11]|nr:MAG: sulfurtransferase [Geobacteraceae bacterium GWC2_53_11]
MISTTLSPRELNQLIENGTVTLIDVLLPEDYTCRHIAGAENACVYEMVFLDRVAECVPERDKTVVVYDDSGTTMAARTAREKLERAGYRNVAILQGGLRAWQEAGFAVESNVSANAPVPVRDGVSLIDTEQSVVEWSGRNINNRHHGRITIAEGAIVLANGRPQSGRIVLDMNSLSNLDLQDEGWRSMLLRHLKSEDFFDVERFPTVTFELRGASVIDKATPGTANMEIAGVLTIKETARSICFPAIIAPQEDGTIKAHAALDLDRTLWNVCYGSGKLYERLGMHLVNDLISVEMFLVAR